MQVLLTINTEVYPLAPNWQLSQLRLDLDRDIYGITAEGEFGLRHQLRTLQQFQLHATFFVEALFASCPNVLPGALEEVVDLIQSAGQDVQLHLHPEWVPLIPKLAHLHRPGAWRMTHYGEKEQLELIETGLENLERAGAKSVTAYRAGDFAANSDTLRALERAGVKIDSSYNYGYRRFSLIANGDEPCWQPTTFGKVLELPVSCYHDLARHVRHAQICAISHREMRHALESARGASWSTFVIFSHTFEFLRNRRSTSKPVSLNGIALRRFEKLCAYLDAHRPEYQTLGIGQADLSVAAQNAEAISGKWMNTVGRYIEQAIARF